MEIKKTLPYVIIALAAAALGYWMGINDAL